VRAEHAAIVVERLEGGLVAIDAALRVDRHGALGAARLGLGRGVGRELERDEAERDASELRSEDHHAAA
jgi:hypothetical protein